MKIAFQHPGRKGIALVITLIMLAVTLVMAVAFLAVSNRERGSVTTTTDAAHARLAADSALAQAEAQIMSSMLATSNFYNFGMLVSTNYINSYGFVAGDGNNLTNVNYIYPNGNFLSAADLQQNIANLLYLPRAPVFVPTNNGSGYDFRYYLDLNRNGQFDDSGNVPNTEYIGGVYTTNGTVPELGDPQWIGVLEHPDQPHGPNNRFIARFCFMAVPVGNTLDVNAIYNDAAQPFLAATANGLNMYPTTDSYLRNEGVGSWELNLAAFLTDLNTNEWDTIANGYEFNTAGNALGLLNCNAGAPFEDSLELLRYRYNYSMDNQASVQQVYGPLNNLQYSVINNYSTYPLLISPTLPAPATIVGGANINTLPWVGANNTNLFFSPSDFYDKTKTQSGLQPTTRGFTDRLVDAGTNTEGNPNLSQVPTYNRYTYYHMLTQLGTDTTPDYGKMNLNYVNVDTNTGLVLPGMETNYYTWNALEFFTNAANRLLGAYTTNWITADYYDYTNTFGTTTTNAFGFGNIPVQVDGRMVYTPAVNRLLQLAANMFDATTNSFYPSVFRPVFYRDVVSGNVYISGYTNITAVNGVNDPVLATPVDISTFAYQNLSGTITSNVYGVPWIIGAKKGFPNFNEMNVLSTAQVTRLLQVNRTLTNNWSSANYTTNEMFVMTITNSVGVSLWNSYNNDYVSANGLNVFVQADMTLELTNQANPALTTNQPVYYFSYQTNMTTWPGSAWSLGNNSTPPPPLPDSYVSTNWTLGFLAPAAYQYSSGNFIPINTNAQIWPAMGKVNFSFPQMGLMSTNWVQGFILDGTHVIDYVHFSGPNNTRNLSAELADPNYVGPPQFTYMWSTNMYRPGTAVPGGMTGTTMGEANQIFVSRGLAGYGAPPGGQWAGTPAPGYIDPIAGQQAYFNGFFIPSWQYNDRTYANTAYSVQAPYTPTRTMYSYTLWEANDPLVHYLASDLNYTDPGTTGIQKSDTIPPVLNVKDLNLNQLGNRFQPWGMSVQMAQQKLVDTNGFNLAFKDPLIWGSDWWEFPTNKFPSVGWLGAVHRGTPWQTVFLKSTNLLELANVSEGNGTVNGPNTWQVWSGNVGNLFDATNAAPVTDRLLFDLFTTGPNENATLGKLSINQTHLAAWSALFSGLVVYTNANTNLVDVTIAAPAGPNYTNYVPGLQSSYLADLWQSIQQTREQMPGQAFQHLGDILATPALSDDSPFIPTSLEGQMLPYNSDAVYEWLPRQTLSLLTVGAPRYVVYCYGQALKPAPNGIVTSGPYALMCTNYQIVSETATRNLVQVLTSNTNAPQIVLKGSVSLPPDQ